MKTIGVIILTLALSPAMAYAAEELRSRVYVVSGDVVVAQGRNPPHRVTDNERIISDTTVTTGEESAALLKFEDGQVVTMQANSTFRIREYIYDPDDMQNSTIAFAMYKGEMRFISGQIAQNRRQAFRVATPYATIRIHGTDFALGIIDGSMYTRVLSGDIRVTNAAGTSVLSAGQSARVTSPTAAASVVSLAAIPSEGFNTLLSIPTDPSAIVSPAPPPPSPPSPGLPPPPEPVSAPAAVSGVAAVAPEVAPAKAATPEARPPEKPPEPAKVAEEKEVGAEAKSGVGLTGKIGTLGYGLELDLGISDSISSRVGLNAFNYKYNGNSSQLNYDFDWKLQTASALIDWYPFQGSFRASVGALYDNNKINFTAIPTSGIFTINNTTYSTAQVGSVTGTMSFNKGAPYLGIGWGNPVAKNKGWGVVTDIGALYQGAPKVDLTVTCLDPAVCAQLLTDATAENAKLRDDFSHYKWWPVVSIGVSYQW